MFFSLYGKKRVATPSPAQLLILRQRQQLLQMILLAKNNTPESKNYENKIVGKDVIIYELGVETESQEIPQPKLEEPVIQELSCPVVEETRETREPKEKEKRKKKVKFLEESRK